MAKSKKSLIPAKIRAKLPPPERRRDNKVTARFTREEFEILSRMSAERREKVSSFVRNLVLATVAHVRKRGR